MKQKISLSQVVAGRNDRTIFDPQALADLAASIEKDGAVSIPTVRPIAGGMFEIVCGERRTRAYRLLGWAAADFEVVTLTDEQAAAVMLSENTARADLDPIDEAGAYQSRMNQFGWTIEDTALRAGVAPAHVEARLRLLGLRPDLQALVRTDQLKVGYANMLAAASLDNNRQLIAMRDLRNNPSPTPSWFRREVVARLEVEQGQEALFTMPASADAGAVAAASFWNTAACEIKTPAHPSTTTPPVTKGASLATRMKAQILFWRQASAEWTTLGKVFKANECEAAAKALELALASA